LALVFTAPSVHAQAVHQQSCADRISSFVRAYAKPQSRFVLTFTGPQKALTPLWEMMGGPSDEATLFPVGRTLFVLTIQIHVVQPNITGGQLGPWAEMICSTAADHGARYNGAVSYSGNHMTGADMSPPQP
jgi:hypothetical protein